MKFIMFTGKRTVTCEGEFTKKGFKCNGKVIPKEELIELYTGICEHLQSKEFKRVQTLNMQMLATKDVNKLFPQPNPALQALVNEGLRGKFDTNIAQMISNTYVVKDKLYEILKDMKVYKIEILDSLSKYSSQVIGMLNIIEKEINHGGNQAITEESSLLIDEPLAKDAFKGVKVNRAYRDVKVRDYYKILEDEEIGNVYETLSESCNLSESFYFSKDNDLILIPKNMKDKVFKEVVNPACARLETIVNYHIRANYYNSIMFTVNKNLVNKIIPSENLIKPSFNYTVLFKNPENKLVTCMLQVGRNEYSRIEGNNKYSLMGFEGCNYTYLSVYLKIANKSYTDFQEVYRFINCDSGKNYVFDMSDIDENVLFDRGEKVVLKNKLGSIIFPTCNLSVSDKNFGMFRHDILYGIANEVYTTFQNRNKAQRYKTKKNIQSDKNVEVLVENTTGFKRDFITISGVKEITKSGETFIKGKGHSKHKSPVKHYRRGHQRYYAKTNKVVKIPGTWVNVNKKDIVKYEIR